MEDHRVICWDFLHLDPTTTWVAVDSSIARAVKWVDCTPLVKAPIALVTRRHPTCPRMSLSPRRLHCPTTLILRITLIHPLNKICIHPSSLAHVRRHHNNILTKVIHTLALALVQVMELLSDPSPSTPTKLNYTCLLIFFYYDDIKKPSLSINTRAGQFYFFSSQ